MKTAIIVGGGMCGCTSAYLLKKNGWKVILYEKNDYLGGGCKTFFYGGHSYTFGPRPLYTPHKKVFDFLNDFVPMKCFPLYLDTFVAADEQFYSYPVHEDDIPKMPESKEIYCQLKDKPSITESMNFEEYYISSIGRILYDKFVNNYSKKMWGVESNTELTDFKWSVKGVALQKGARRVQKDLIIAHPTSRHGYNEYFEKMTQDVDEIHYGVNVEKFDVQNKAVKINNEWKKANIVVSTTSVDMLMDYCYGELRYIGREFIKLVLPIERAMKKPVMLYYSSDEPYTRVVEYKRLYHYKAPTTLIGMEIPSFKNKLYPYPITTEREKAQKYLTALPEGIFSMGRMGRYVYDNIGEVILQAFELVEKLK